MTTKTISKFSNFVIVLAAVSLTFSSCTPSFKGSGPKAVGKDGKSEDYAPPKIVGKIGSAAIKESSGIAASRCRPGVFWTHNDSGDGPVLYALDATGKSLGAWRVEGAENIDWEDIAAGGDATRGDCSLYVGEIGNNELKRTEFKIYRVAEPEAAGNDPGGDQKTASVEKTIRFRYPDGPHNAETLMIHPVSGDLYVLTKSRKDAAGVYKIPAGADGVEAKKIAEISVPAIPDGLLTGGDISPDGKRVVVCDYFQGYEFLLPADAADFDAIWKTKPLAIEIGDREIGEAICYSADGRSIFATSENPGSPMIRIDRK